MILVSRYADGMRYPQGGGFDSAGRARREKIRLQAAELIDAGRSDVEIARELRVSAKSACVWRGAYRDGGLEALRSKGHGGQQCLLTDEQITLLTAALDEGPAAHGHTDDQRWTLARISDLISDMFGVRYAALRTVSRLLHRAGYSWQVPARRAAERDEEVIKAWREEAWRDIKARPYGSERGSASRTKPAKV
jgi:transposase